METLTTSEAAVAGGILGGAFAAVLVFGLIWALLSIIAGWKIFEKAGEKGWKILIPIYNMYILFKIVGMQMWFWITFCASLFVSIIIGAMGLDVSKITADSFSGNMLVPALLYVADGIFACVVSIVVYYRLSKAFGHGVGFTIGLVLLNSIFMLILGFGSSKFDKKVVKAWEK